jgi:hypothetical protein
MILAKTMALSIHSTEVTPQVWDKVKALDKRRKARIQ